MAAVPPAGPRHDILIGMDEIQVHRTLSRDAAKCSTFVAFLAVKLISSRVMVLSLVTGELLVYLGGGLSQHNNTQNVLLLLLLLLNWPMWMRKSFLRFSLLCRPEKYQEYVIKETLFVFL